MHALNVRPDTSGVKNFWSDIFADLQSGSSLQELTFGSLNPMCLKINVAIAASGTSDQNESEHENVEEGD